MVDSSDLAQVLAEAEDISQSVHQKLTTAHLLLALFTVENRADVLLRERGVDEDRILQTMTSAPSEPDGLIRELRDRSREIARNCGSPEADCLHLLIAISRVRCAANDLLTNAGVDLTALRNTALSYFLSGRMPRKLQLGRPLPLRVPSRTTTAATLTTWPETTKPTVSVISARELADGPDDLPMPMPTPPVTPLRVTSVPQERIETGSKTAPVVDLRSQVELDPKLFPLLCSLGKNLTAIAAQGRLDPVIGREREMDEVIDILGKRRTNNPCLLGEPGVGKTAVVEGVAQQLRALSHPGSDRILIELDMATLVSGTQLRGSFSEKLNAIKDEVRRAEGRVVVFIDEIHTLIGAGSTGEGPQDAANELKAAMSRGEFPCIGATTHDEYRKFISQDPALERRFTPVVVNEPTVPQTIEILKGIIGRYEEHHGLTYSPAALEAAASLAARYVSDRFLPDKAISITDLAGSRCRREGKVRVEPPDVARVVAKLAGVPEERLLMNDSARLLRLEEELKARVIGHTHIAERIARVIRRNYAGFASRRPMGSFLFLGPTGVGKTEMAKAVAQVLFGSPDALVRIDMSEMSEAHGTSRLIGSPAGYVGYGDSGQLTEPVRRRPSSVVLLDEIDKAHRDTLMLLLQVLEEGRLTDGKGRHIDFSNTVLILTSNLGAEAFTRTSRRMGFSNQDDDGVDATNVQGASDAARRALPPELWNRIDERLAFRPLAEEEVAQIAHLLLEQSSQRLASEKGIAYWVESEVVTHLLRSGGYDPTLGARPMRQTVQRLVEGPLAEKILCGEFLTGDRVKVGLREGTLVFRRDRA